MKPVVELISAWADYESKYPDASATEFCSHFLSQQKVSLPTGIQKNSSFAQSELQTEQDDTSTHQLADLIGQLNAFHVSYSKTALKEIPGVELEWFYFLKAIAQQKEARKSDVVNAVLFEQSTGIDIINRIKKAGLITERNDPADKRARLVKLNPQGEKLLQELHECLTIPDQLLFQGLAEQHKKLLINLLTDVALKNRLMLSEKHQSAEKPL